MWCKTLQKFLTWHVDQLRRRTESCITDGCWSFSTITIFYGFPFIITTSVNLYLFIFMYLNWNKKLPTEQDHIMCTMAYFIFFLSRTITFTKKIKETKFVSNKPSCIKQTFKSPYWQQKNFCRKLLVRVASFTSYNRRGIIRDYPVNAFSIASIFKEKS